jgi:DNA-binding CsgD family transcriptional regulator
VISESPVAAATLEAMLGALPVPAFTTDLGGVVTWQNAAAQAVLGDLGGAHFSKAVPPEELQRAREGFAAVTLSGATTRRTGFFRATNGELVNQEVIAAPIRVDGNIAGVFGIAIPSSDLPRPAATEHLSPRQLDVLRLLAQAKSTSQIAADLHLAPETVRNHVRSLLKALGARSRLEATLVALRDGVVSLDLD